ncbi:hypothetical protein BKA66DRAFT_143266 [Pyrenochaeta sp. MPI-SDFR-AT-0127]|nr:hypothetical protein BKA66DRAFT_143266 [Pyrenochaeta sp. MPI-SDFR-AT-0127]
MKLLYLLCSLICYQPALALSIPKSSAQQPLQPEQQLNRLQYATGVILGFTQRGSNEEHHFEIPLRARISSGANLPSHPSTMKIIAVINDDGLSVPLEGLERVICRVVPNISVEERAAVEQKVWPWFTVQDATVQFEVAFSRWYLGGRSIESYECR